MPDAPQSNGYVKGFVDRSNSFQDLVNGLRTLLGPSSGIDSNDVNPAILQKLMREYISNPSEWVQYAFQDHSRNYTRNLVDGGNGKCNLVRKNASIPSEFLELI